MSKSDSDTTAFAPGWADGFSRQELLRRAQVYRDIASAPGIYIQDRNAAERMVARYEEAANGNR